MQEQNIPTKQHTLLKKIINNKWCFNKRDNTFTLSNRETAKKLKVSASSVDQLHRTLSKQSLTTKVRVSYIDKNGDPKEQTLKMLSPIFMWWYSPLEKWQAIALFHLKSFEEVREWRRVCRYYNCYIDPESGEMFDFNWYYITEFGERYTSFDRCWRRKDMQKNYLKHGSEQWYRIEDSELGELTEYDYNWFDEANNESKYQYLREGIQLFQATNGCTSKEEKLQDLFS